MKTPDKNNKTRAYLESRVKHLEDVERFAIDGLEMAASLGDFQNSINRLSDISTLLEETKIRIQGLIPSESIAFYLVEEGSNDFIMKYIDSETYRLYIQNEVNHVIDNGTFAWALREKRPIIVPTGDGKELLLHVMATTNRVRGLCVALLPHDHQHLLNISLSLLSTVLLNSANAIESFELYRTIKEINSNLERIDNYRLLFEAAPDGVEVLDAAGNILDNNDSQTKLLGYPREHLLGSHSSVYFSEGSRTSFAQNHLTLQEKGYWEGEVELVTAKGEIIAVWRKEKAIYDKVQKFIGAVVYNRDITLRKRAEEAALESQWRLFNIIEFLPDATFVIDRESKVIAWNRAIEAMTGIRKEAMLGKGNYEYAIPFYGDRRPILIDHALKPEKEAEKKYREIQRAGDIVFGESYTANLPPNHLHLSAAASVLRDSKGEVIGAIECIRDNTEHKRIEDRLSRAEKMEALGTLAGGVAHDLNNVMGVLVGYSELLVEKLPAESSLKRYAGNILQSGLRGAAIIQDLLTLARRGVTVAEVVDLNRLVCDYLRTPELEKLKSYYPEVKIRTELEEGLLHIKGSPVHLGKTIMNLISNAAESISGPGEVSIITENRYLDQPIRGYDEMQEGDYAVLMVQDSGGGIPSTDIGKIFEPFYTKKVMGRSGTGLGLAVVWGTVKDHHGYIDVQSEESKGSKFSLYFPVTREKMEKAEKNLSPVLYMGKGEFILVVDDVKEQRELAMTMLERLGYQVEAVASGEEALAYLRNKKADLMVLDMIMDPGMDGFTTYRKIQEINPGQKAVMVSGFSETERVRNAQEIGAGDFVRKPYILEKIGRAVRKELDRK